MEFSPRRSSPVFRPITLYFYCCSNSQRVVENRIVRHTADPCQRLEVFRASDLNSHSDGLTQPRNNRNLCRVDASRLRNKENMRERAEALGLE